MIFTRSIIPLSVALALCACGSDSNTSSNRITPQTNSASLTLVLPTDNQALVENFPISQYVTYEQGESFADSISSINVDWPKVHVYQAGKQHGFIDGSSNELFYHTNQQISSDALNAVDIERLDDVMWFISGKDELHQVDSQTDSTQMWKFEQGAELTEIAIATDDDLTLWLYDQANQQLIHFDPLTETADSISLSADIVINGLTYHESQLLILGRHEEQFFVAAYANENNQLSHLNSWYIQGFDGSEITDIAVLPDGGIVISTNDSDNNLVQVADLSANLGDGPITDTGQLQLSAQIDLDPQISQPSGLWAMDDGAWMIITDQAQMYRLTEDFSVVEAVTVEFASQFCNQGCTEAIVGNFNEFFAMTDQGLVGHFTKNGTSYQLEQEYQINISNEQDQPYEYGGLGHNPATGEFYLVPDQGDPDEVDKLIVLNSDFTLKEQHVIHYSGDVEGSIHEFDAQGVSYYQDFIYVMSERYTKLLKLNLAGEIVEVFELDHEVVAFPSDIAIRQGQVFIIGDHENDQPVPPVSIFDIERY